MARHETMYKVDYYTNTSSIKKLEVVKITEHTVLTDKGERHHKKCSSYEVFDSFITAKNEARIYSKNQLESLRNQLKYAEEKLKDLELKTEIDFK